MKRVEPKSIIQTYKKLKSTSLTARKLGISRNTVKTWVIRARYPYTRKLSSRNLKRKSTRPKTIHRKLDTVSEIQLVELRKSMRFNIDQSKLAKLYVQKYSKKVSSKTVYNILKRRAPELIQSKPKYKRPRF